MDFETIKNYIDNELESYIHLVPISNGGDLNDLINSMKAKQDAVSRIKEIFEPNFNEFCKSEKVSKEDKIKIEEYLSDKLKNTINSIMKR